MRWFLAVAILMGLTGFGCDDGTQKGRFAVFEYEGRALDGNAGELYVLRGGPLPLAQGGNNSTPLLYVLVLLPDATVAGSSTSTSNKTHETICEWKWTTADKPLALDLTWDRRRDVVSGAGATFDRKNGNTFLALVSADGTVSLSQVTTIAGAPTFQTALQQIQAALPNTSPARNVTLR